jgi:hypothetical protein
MAQDGDSETILSLHLAIYLRSAHKEIFFIAESPCGDDDDARWQSQSEDLSGPLSRFAPRRTGSWEHSATEIHVESNPTPVNDASHADPDPDPQRFISH